MSESGEVRMGVSEARANLTEVIAKVRLLGQQVVLTRREKPQAALVSPDFYQRALMDRAVVEQLMEKAQDPGPDAKPDEKLTARVIGDALANVVPSPF